MTLQQKVAGVFVPVGGGGAVEDWTRPADWLTLPTVTSGEQKFVGLVAVWPGGSNWVSMNVLGAYTVDWGDGSAAENVASGVTANHNILWADVDAGTLTTLGYRQAVVVVTMQGAANFTTLNLNVDAVAMNAGASSLWLDIAMAGANLTVLTVGGTTAHAGALQRFEYVGPSAITSTTPAFYTSRALRKIVGTTWTAGCLTFEDMFIACTALTTIPTLDTSSGTTFQGMFSGATALAAVEAGALDTSAGTTFQGMFDGARALAAVEAGALDTSAGTTFAGMFNNCAALTTIPPMVVSAATTHSTMFSACRSLRVGALSGTRETISYASCALSATELDAIYTGLATVTSKTITVTGNWGVAGDTPSLATSKGWTVTG